MEANSKPRNDKLESSPEGSSGQSAPQPPLLPRDAWESKTALLRAILKAKQSLYRAEQEVD